MLGRKKKRKVMLKNLAVGQRIVVKDQNGSKIIANVVNPIISHLGLKMRFNGSTSFIPVANLLRIAK